MPVGVVDLDNTSMTRTLITKLDGFQTSHVVAHYPSFSEARRAMQHEKIYAFLYIPKGTTDALIAQRQPSISFYYSTTSLTAGSLLFRDLKTVATLGSAGVGQATMRAKGYTDEQIMDFLQPIRTDVHPIGNPWINYNSYLSTMLVPGCLMLFVMLLTAFSLGSEVKHGKSKLLYGMAKGNIFKIMIGKLMPQTIIFFLMMMIHMTYMFSYLGFPHIGGYGVITLLSLLTILAGQGFGVFAFAMFPNMRMSMSVCSLWAVLSFSMVGTAFPVFAMDPPLEALAWMFPLRHYFMIYAGNVFNGLPVSDTYIHFAMLVFFASLPLLFAFRVRRAFRDFIYVK